MIDIFVKKGSNKMVVKAKVAVEREKNKCECTLSQHNKPNIPAILQFQHNILLG